MNDTTINNDDINENIETNENNENINEEAPQNNENVEVEENTENQEDDFYSQFLNDLKAMLEYRDIEIPPDAILKIEIDKAIGEINRCRRFTPTEELRYDTKYKDLVIPMCVSALAKVGIEGENSHSENGVQRIYVSDGEYPESLTSRIIPLIK